MSNNSAFYEHGIDETVAILTEQIQNLYLEDDIPWIVGYSGGKDSTATLQLVWDAVVDLPAEKRHKPVHIISTDTLVENPVVALWVGQSLKSMQKAIDKAGIPFYPHRLTPEAQNSFWVNLVGKGYPAPRPKFRWCTERLKIKPANKFISEIVKTNGEAILVLGTRKAESATRHASMKRHEKSTRNLLSKNADPSLDRAWVYPPIGEWSNDDVWEYLMLYKNPWDHDNDELFTMYRGATKDNECPLVVDSTTPSCGDSRFGCFVCTMVDQDRSMMAMIQNDEEKQWMKPLLDIRNKWLDKNDRDRRDFRRMNGALMTYSYTTKEDGKEVTHQQLVHGPYKQDYRITLLTQILKAQVEVQNLGPPEVRSMELITIDELEEIRRIWVMDKHEIEDCLPSVYEEIIGKPYPIQNLDESQIFKPDDLAILEEICREQGDTDGIQYRVIRELLHLEQSHRTMARRSGLYTAIDKALERGAFNNEKEAEEFAIRRDKAIQEARNADLSDLQQDNIQEVARDAA